jgi:hypothetical protein
VTRRRKPTSGTTLTVVCPIHPMMSNPVFRIHWDNQWARSGGQ